MTADPNTTAGMAAEPEPIVAVPLRRPGRWVSAAVILALAGLFVYGAATNPAYRWDVYWKYLRDTRIAEGAVVTLELTVLAMFIAVALGTLLAVMRLSPNPVLRSSAWVYLWVFRGTPVYIQLVFWGLVPSLYQNVAFGVPFGPRLLEIDVQSLQAGFAFAVIGLGLNEAAYMAEIVRAGINSVGEGQREASIALGMSWSQTMRRTVLPQAMRVIIPPTGNELISMLKTTALVTAIPLSTDLFGRARDIYGVNFLPIPLLLVTATWYLAITSVLMVGQYYLEKYYSRGISRQLTAKQLQELADARGEAPAK
ncbi:amino acid ABC transporter permease [Nocardia sp. NBC_01329]|uniref:amino acid ABC transporter permease n=1 Tax=Nocardia sp. NBC_01329 TaxID=2903594 RepID=UPI002E0DD048|nr:amino acid ABC transporter permease [Nocardia sp. NBC_01329]